MFMGVAFGGLPMPELVPMEISLVVQIISQAYDPRDYVRSCLSQESVKGRGNERQRHEYQLMGLLIVD
jgi:hypothetical protein